MSPGRLHTFGALRGFEQTEPKSQVQGAGQFCSSPQENPHPPVRSRPLLAALLGPRGRPTPTLSSVSSRHRPRSSSCLLASEKRSPSLPRMCPLPCIGEPHFSWGAVSAPQGVSVTGLKPCRCCDLWRLPQLSACSGIHFLQPLLTQSRHLQGGFQEQPVVPSQPSMQLGLGLKLSC